MRLIRGVPPRSSPSPTVCDTNSFFPAHDGRKEFVSQTVGEGELRRGPPRIHRIKRMARLEVVHDERRREVCSVYVAEQEVRDSERPARRVHSVDLQFTLRSADVHEVVAAPQVLIPKLEAVAALQPAQVVDQVPRLRNLILRTPG